ncbi:MAG: hypothetical protein H7222_08625 [Methylotenera sp.]|nr:hypothetical protein [Oligoflexia bacterium]
MMSTYSVLNVLRFAAVAAVLMAAPGPLHAEELDGASQEALTKTQHLLQDSVLRSQELGRSAEGKEVGRQVESISGNAANQDEMYRVSGKVLEDIARTSDGDAEKMKRLTAAGKDDPESFFDGLSEESRRAIRSLAGKISESPAAGNSGKK